MFVDWNPGPTVADEGIIGLTKQIVETLAAYRKDYESYYKAHALEDSPAIRDASPTVVLIPGIGMFSFGRNKTEARITGEFYTNAIHVMAGASALGHGLAPLKSGDQVPQAGPAANSSQFSICSNYVALPPSEAFRIEYWVLEEAKIRRQPPEKEFSGKIVLIVGGGNGIGREAARLAAERGAHVVVADRDAAAMAHVVEELTRMCRRKQRPVFP